MRIIARIAAAVVIAASLTACNQHMGPKGTAGTLLGAAAGGLLGAQFGSGSGKLAMVALGVLAGSAMGQHIGTSMDQQDAARATRTFETAPTGQQVAWVNPDTNVHHTVTPTRTMDSREGPCREFTHTASIGGRSEQVYGTACRQADGSWRIVQ